MASQQERLQLDRGRTNQTFQSWRLSRGSDSTHASLTLPENVYTAREGSYDYLHTRASLLDNHLKSQGSTLYSFLQGAADVNLAKLETSAQACDIIAGLPKKEQHADMCQMDAEAPPLDCSMAQVQCYNMSSTTQDKQYLLSLGRGDMVLLKEWGTMSRTSTPVQITKLNGRPFCIEGAWQVSPGVLRAAVWTLEAKSEAQSAACNVHVLTLHVAADLTLTEWDAHLLLKAKLPPHAVVVSAEEDAVALAVDTLKADSSPANPGLAGTSMNVDGKDDDVPSPRTLRAAAERLAQYTSERPDAGPTTQGQGFADIYSEVSPQDEGLSTEPECEIYCYSWSRQAPAPDTPSRQEAGSAGSSGAPEPSQATQPPGRAHDGPRLTAEVTCSPLRVLTGQGPDLDRSSALLGLIDDVDCAVVSLAITNDPVSPMQLQHVASIPALAYVATGKTQRKYTLLGKPGSGIAAVIVEANRFAYVYHETPPSQAYGTHQVLDLELPREATVLGAVLDTRPSVRPSLHILVCNCVKSFDVSG